MLERLISMTLAGGLAYVLLLISKRILTRRPKTLYFACLLVMLLFIFPFRPTVSLRLDRRVSIDAAPTKTVATAPVSAVETAGKEAPVHAEETEEVAVSRPPINRTPFTLGEIIAALWLAGAALIFIRYIISYLLFRRKILKNSEAIDVQNGLRIVRGKVASPMLVGFFRPVVVMPALNMEEEDYLLAIRHEITHWRRRDPWIKLLAAAVNALHWFNPAAYALIHTLDEACEYACDSEVLKSGDDNIRRRYSTMLLNMVCNSSPILSENMARSKNQLRRRFDLIVNRRKRNIFTSAVSVLAAAGLALGSVALAEVAAPAISSLFYGGYVQSGSYYTKSPVYVDGELYLPFIEILCDVGRGEEKYVENQHVTYGDGRITVQIWSWDGDEHLWDAEFEVGSTAAVIDGSIVRLVHAPVLHDGEPYVAYEVFKVLRKYELTYNTSEHGSDRLNIDLMAYDNISSRFTTNCIGNYYTGAFGEDIIIYDIQVTLAKSGKRTEFKLTTDGFTEGSKELHTLEITLNEVERSFSGGRQIEGLFTVKADGITMADRIRGYLNDIPTYDSSRYECTELIVDGGISIEMYFKGRPSASYAEAPPTPEKEAVEKQTEEMEPDPEDETAEPDPAPEVEDEPEETPVSDGPEQEIVPDTEETVVPEAKHSGITTSSVNDFIMLPENPVSFRYSSENGDVQYSDYALVLSGSRTGFKVRIDDMYGEGEVRIDLVDALTGEVLYDIPVIISDEYPHAHEYMINAYSAGYYENGFYLRFRDFEGDVGETTVTVY